MPAATKSMDSTTQCTRAHSSTFSFPIARGPRPPLRWAMPRRESRVAPPAVHAPLRRCGVSDHDPAIVEPAPVIPRDSQASGHQSPEMVFPLTRRRRKPGKVSAPRHHTPRGRVIVPPGSWKPQHSHIIAVYVAAVNPKASTKELATLLGLSERTIYDWHKDPNFDRWWNAQLLESARNFAGPAMRELRAIITDPEIPARDRVRAVEVFLKQVGGVMGDHQAAVLSILEAFRGAGPGAELHLAAKQDSNGSNAVAGIVRNAGRPDAELLETERLGQECGALRATESAERAASHIALAMRRVARDPAKELVPQASTHSLGIRDGGPAPIPPGPCLPPWKSPRKTSRQAGEGCPKVMETVPVGTSISRPILVSREESAMEEGAPGVGGDGVSEVVDVVPEVRHLRLSDFRPVQPPPIDENCDRMRP